MIYDVWTVMWKEGMELLRLRTGSLRGGTLGVVIFLCCFGILLPLQMGSKWVELPAYLLFWAWVPLFLVSSVVADSFAGERERNTLETLLASCLSDQAILIGKVGSSMAYGCGLTLISLLMGVISVNMAYRFDTFIFYSPMMFLGILLWIFLGAGLAACTGVLVSLRASTVKQAQQSLSIGIMLLLILPMFGWQALSGEWQWKVEEAVSSLGLTGIVILVSGILALLDGLLLFIAMARFRRARLILD